MSRLASLPLINWPEADKAVWADLTAPGDALDQGGALSHLRATSQAGLIKRYGRWLEYLYQVHPETISERPAWRATPERVRDWCASLEHIAPPTRLTYVNGALQVLREAEPENDWRLQCRLLKSLTREVRRWDSPRKIGRIFPGPVLLEAACDLAGPTAAAANTPLNAALMRRNGTMIALFTLAPIRLRSFSELTLGRSVLVTQKQITLVLSGDMTKNHLPWEVLAPPALETLLREYIHEVRPWLMRNLERPHDALWVGRMGEPYSYRTIANTIPAATCRQLGVPVSPHLFRDAAATTIAQMAPENVLSIAPILGHSSSGIVERHYNHATAIEAGRDYAKVITELTEGDD